MTQGEKPQGASLDFLELKLALDTLVDNMPYQIRYFGVNAQMLQERFQALQKAGFTRHEAFEIIKARGID